MFRAPSHEGITFLQPLLSEHLELFQYFGLLIPEKLVKLLHRNSFATFVLEACHFLYCTSFYVHFELLLTTLYAESMFACAEFECDLICDRLSTSLDHVAVANRTFYIGILLFFASGYLVVILRRRSRNLFHQHVTKTFSSIEGDCTVHSN